MATIKIKNFGLSVRFFRTVKRTGVCSRIYNEPDKHILMWDFDNTEKNKLLEALENTQRFYELPAIYVIESSHGKHHAYCFVKRSLKDIIHILSATNYIDEEYLRLGMVRGYYTLRISKRNETDFQLVIILHSDKADELSALDVTTNKFETENIGGKNG